MALFDPSLEYALVEEFGQHAYPPKGDNKLYLETSYTNYDFVLNRILVGPQNYLPENISSNFGFMGLLTLMSHFPTFTCRPLISLILSTATMYDL